METKFNPYGMAQAARLVAKICPAKSPERKLGGQQVLKVERVGRTARR
jgi:hypothetical protein